MLFVDHMLQALAILIVVQKVRKFINVWMGIVF